MADARFAGGWGAAVLKANRNNMSHATPHGRPVGLLTGNIAALIFDAAALGF
jgi:hypothetical protein